MQARLSPGALTGSSINQFPPDKSTSMEGGVRRHPANARRGPLARATPESIDRHAGSHGVGAARLSTPQMCQFRQKLPTGRTGGFGTTAVSRPPIETGRRSKCVAHGPSVGGSKKRVGGRACQSSPNVLRTPHASDCLVKQHKSLAWTLVPEPPDLAPSFPQTAAVAT